jgi:histidyl-tRNA synthetase
MSNKPSLVKGTRDFDPFTLRKRKYILHIIEQVFTSYGFIPLETPAMENLTTLEGKYGDEGDKLLYRIINSGDAFSDIKNKSNNGTIPIDALRISAIAEKGLRYDLTVPFARYVAMNRNEITFPFRRYQMQPVWRADRPQKGRYREFWQCDADCIGSKSLINELDLIMIYHTSFTKLGLKDYLIKLNNRKVLAGIAEVVKSQDYLITIATAIDKLDKIQADGVKNELIEKGFTDKEVATLFDIITIKGSNSEILELMQQKLQTSVIGMEGIAELRFIINTLQNNPEIAIKLDFSLARGLNYYTGCILEIVNQSSTLTSSIGGGGRYDNLTGNFGLPDVSGVGISFGLDRIFDVMDELHLFPDNIKTSPTDVLICYFDEPTQIFGYQIANTLRAKAIATELYPDITKKIGKQLDYANALGIPYCIVIGSNELANGKVQLKNMRTTEQHLLSIDEVLNILLPV